MFRKAAALCAACCALAVLLTACCDCPSYPVRTIRWTGLHLIGGAYRTDSTNTVFAEDDTGADFSGKNYLLRAVLDYRFAAAVRRAAGVALLGTAYACKCSADAESVRGQTEWTGLQVYSLRAFDAAHPAGSEVTDCFGVPDYSYPRQAALRPYGFLSQQHYYGHQPLIEADLYLTRRPVAGSRQQFRVEVRFGDGSSSTALTPELQF